MHFRYIDYIGSWGPAIVGAANDEVNDALKTQIDKGTSYGAPCELEVILPTYVNVPQTNMEFRHSLKCLHCTTSQAFGSCSYGVQPQL